MIGRHWFYAAITTVVAVTGVILAAAGLDALIHLGQPQRSIAQQALGRFFWPAPRPDGPPWPELVDEKQIRPYLAALKASNVGLGNTPYAELVSDAASATRTVDGCLEMKPDIRKTVSFFRSELFDTLNPPSYFHDVDEALPNDLRAFLDRYGFRKVYLTTNRYGERMTTPAAESPDKIIVAGASIPMGAMLDDSETIASQLQAADRTHQYVNIGISGGNTKDVVCALKRAAAHYPNQIREILYLYSENELKTRLPFGTPQEIIPWLATFKSDNGIGRITIVYMPYIYNSIPEVTRIPGTAGFGWPRHGTEKQALREGAQRAGFRWLDYTDITEAEKKAAGNIFAPFALYVDRNHLSRLGTARLVERLHAKDVVPTL